MQWKLLCSNVLQCSAILFNSIQTSTSNVQHKCTSNSLQCTSVKPFCAMSEPFSRIFTGDWCSLLYIKLCALQKNQCQALTTQLNTLKHHHDRTAVMWLELFGWPLYFDHFEVIFGTKPMGTRTKSACKTNRNKATARAAEIVPSCHPGWENVE